MTTSATPTDIAEAEHEAFFCAARRDLSASVMGFWHSGVRSRLFLNDLMVIAPATFPV
jgi:hypothetical protein